VFEDRGRVLYEKQQPVVFEDNMSRSPTRRRGVSWLVFLLASLCASSCQKEPSPKPEQPEKRVTKQYLPVYLEPEERRLRGQYSHVYLEWSYPHTGVSYAVWRRQGDEQSGNPWLNIAFLPNSLDCFVDRSVRPGETYCYAYTAVDRRGLESPFSNIITMTPVETLEIDVEANGLFAEGFSEKQYMTTEPPRISRIAYIVADSPRLADLYVIDANGAHLQRLTVDLRTESVGHLQWFSDSKRILFHASASLGRRWTGSLWLADIERGTLARVDTCETPGKYRRSGYALSPDEQSVVFTEFDREKPSYWRRTLWKIDVDGTNKRELCNLKGKDLNPHWSMSGENILLSDGKGKELWMVDSSGQDMHEVSREEYGRHSRSGPEAPIELSEGDIWILGEDGEKTRRVTVMKELGCSIKRAYLSPDGRRIAFVAPTVKGTEIKTIDADGGTETTLVEGQLRREWLLSDKDKEYEKKGALKPPPEYYCYCLNLAPCWSPDDSRIAFMSDRSGDFDIWVVNSDGTGLERLTTHPGFDGYPSWSPDGLDIVFCSDREGNGDIWVMRADGSEPRNLTRSKRWDGNPVWFADGTSISFLSDSSNAREIWVVGSDGRSLRKPEAQELDSVLAERERHTLSPDGSRILYVSRAFGMGPELWTKNLDGSDLKKLSASCISPVWSNRAGSEEEKAGMRPELYDIKRIEDMKITYRSYSGGPMKSSTTEVNLYGNGRGIILYDHGSTLRKIESSFRFEESELRELLRVFEENKFFQLQDAYREYGLCDGGGFYLWKRHNRVECNQAGNNRIRWL
jgi:Tol biopolymer transport system component